MGFARMIRLRPACRVMRALLAPLALLALTPCAVPSGATLSAGAVASPDRYGALAAREEIGRAHV